jgi:hypothetical protein
VYIPRLEPNLVLDDILFDQRGKAQFYVPSLLGSTYISYSLPLSKVISRKVYPLSPWLTGIGMAFLCLH